MLPAPAEWVSRLPRCSFNTRTLSHPVPPSRNPAHIAYQHQTTGHPTAIPASQSRMANRAPNTSNPPAAAIAPAPHKFIFRSVPILTSNFFCSQAGPLSITNDHWGLAVWLPLAPTGPQFSERYNGRLNGPIPCGWIRCWRATRSLANPISIVCFFFLPLR